MPIKHQLIAAVGRASEGQTVAWIGPSRILVHEDFVSIADAIADGATVRRANGRESIEFPNGGRIWFKSKGPGNRGFVCDRLYVPSSISDDDLMELEPTVATSKDGAIVSY